MACGFWYEAFPLIQPWVDRYLLELWTKNRFLDDGKRIHLSREAAAGTKVRAGDGVREEDGAREEDGVKGAGGARGADVAREVLYMTRSHPFCDHQSQLSSRDLPRPGS